MTYETKFKPGDIVFFMKNNLIASGTVTSLEVKATPKITAVIYSLRGEDRTFAESDNLLYASRKEVAESLLTMLS